MDHEGIPPNSWDSEEDDDSFWGLIDWQKFDRQGPMYDVMFPSIVDALEESINESDDVVLIKLIKEDDLIWRGALDDIFEERLDELIEVLKIHKSWKEGEISEEELKEKLKLSPELEQLIGEVVEILDRFSLRDDLKDNESIKKFCKLWAKAWVKELNEFGDVGFIDKVYKEIWKHLLTPQKEAFSRFVRNARKYRQTRQRKRSLEIFRDVWRDLEY